MANLSGNVDTVDVHTPPSVVGGGIIHISTITHSTVVVGSTSISILSGGTQPSALFVGSYPFGIPSSGIPSVSSTLPFSNFSSMTLMATNLVPL